MSNLLDRLANAAIAVAALALTGMVAQRQFGWFQQQDQVHAPPPIYLADWESLDSVGLSLDDNKGKLRVFVFSDIECPYCALFHQATIPSLYKRYPGQVSVRFVHFPLRSHRFARQSAAALECAAVQGRASNFLDVAYAKQDSIGLIPWTQYAHTAGVMDTAAFMKCFQNAPHPRIAAGAAIGEKMEVASTPTIVVNGWRFTGIPDSADFVASLDSIKAGADPFVSTRTP